MLGANREGTEDMRDPENDQPEAFNFCKRATDRLSRGPPGPGDIRAQAKQKSAGFGNLTARHLDKASAPDLWHAAISCGQGSPREARSGQGCTMKTEVHILERSGQEIN